MEFKAVEFMRRARDKITRDTQGMSWAEVREYLRQHSRWLDDLPQDLRQDLRQGEPGKENSLFGAGKSAPSPQGEQA